MTVDIADIAAQADALWRNPNHPASVAFDVAKLWEQAARDLAAERDAPVEQLGQAGEQWGTRHLGSPEVDLRQDEADARWWTKYVPTCDLWRRTVHYGPWIEVQP